MSNEMIGMGMVEGKDLSNGSRNTQAEQLSSSEQVKTGNSRQRYRTRRKAEFLAKKRGQNMGREYMFH